MSECRYLAACPFFNDKMVNMPAISQACKDKYCHKEYMHCARYTVLTALGREEVPPDMSPNQHDRARYIINKVKDKQ